MGHKCGHDKGNTTRYKHATFQYKRIVKVWKPKIVQPSVIEPVKKEVEPQTKATSDRLNDDIGDLGTNAIHSLNDRPFTPLVPTQDEGWKVVSRRKIDVRTPVHTVGAC